MTERITLQEDIDAAATSHLRAILPLLECIGAGYTEQVSAGYVERDGEVERLTDMGVSMVESAYKVAWDSATYLFEDVLANAAPSLDTDLLDDVQQFLAVTASALDGMDIQGAPPGVAPPWVSTCLLSMARELMERLDDNGGHGRTRDRRSTEEEPEAATAVTPTTEDGWGPGDARGELGEVLEALNVATVLLTPFRSDNWGDGDSGMRAALQDGSIKPEGYHHLDRVVEALGDARAKVFDATAVWRPEQYEELMRNVDACLLPAQWCLKALYVSYAVPSPDLQPINKPAEIVDRLLDQVAQLRNEVMKMHEDGEGAAKEEAAHA